MDIVIQPRPLRGTVAAIPSKSQAHRLLICAAFADGPTRLLCPDTNRDIEATARCLSALGADIQRDDAGYLVHPIARLPVQARLDCGESGSTLRFLLPIVGALGVDTVFALAGRLPQRPLSPLWEEMERMGCLLSRPGPATVRCQGQLQPGGFAIDGSVSSQFITGLLFAASLLPRPSRIRLTGKVESRPYITMTQLAMARFGVSTENLQIPGGQRYRSPGEITVEGDWSNAAFFLAAKALGSDVTVTGLAPDSPQGDRAAAELLPGLEAPCEICGADIPDLIPILAVTAGAKRGAVFTQIQRLRLKESDRISSTAAMLSALGIQTEAEADRLRVFPGHFTGGTVDSAGDHRIAMAAAIAATAASGPVTVLGAECVEKSYPSFWAEYRRLGGSYEQHIR